MNGSGDVGSGNQSIIGVEQKKNPKKYEHFIDPVDAMERGDQIEELKFGAQLADDVINAFCDKLEKVCPRKIEGFLAIQYLSLCDSSEIEQHISGKHDVLQVLFDDARKHYCLVFKKSSENIVYLYDSLQQWDANFDAMIPGEIQLKICKLFGHLSHGKIYAGIDQEYDKQKDAFSCGYRVIGAIVDLARGRAPGGVTYDLTKILLFIRWITKTPNPKWEHFENVQIGVEKPGYCGDFIRYIQLKDPLDTDEDCKDITFETDNESVRSVFSEISSVFDSLEPDLISNCSKSSESILSNFSPKKRMISKVPAKMDILTFNSFKKMFSGLWKIRNSQKAQKID